MNKENKLKFSDDDLRLVETILDNYHPDHHTIKHIMFEANVGHLQKHVFKHPNLIDRGFKHVLNAEKEIPLPESVHKFNPHAKYYTDGDYFFTVNDHPYTKERDINIQGVMYNCPGFIKPTYINTLAIGISREKYNTAVRAYKFHLEKQAGKQSSGFKLSDIPPSFADMRSRTRKSATITSTTKTSKEMKEEVEKIMAANKEIVEEYEKRRAKMNGPSESILSPGEPRIGGIPNRIDKWETYTFDLEKGPTQ